jgi:hypothetical protein
MGPDDQAVKNKRSEMKRTRKRWIWPFLLGMSLCLYAQKPSNATVGDLQIEIRQSSQPGGGDGDPFEAKAVVLSWKYNQAISHYYVESSLDLNQWVPAGDFSAAALGDPGPNGRHAVEIENISASRKFYRVRGVIAPQTTVPVQTAPLPTEPLTTIPMPTISL